MATMKLSEVRQAVATAIATALGASGWRESDDVFDHFGRGGDGEGRGHMSYAVGIPASTALKDRQRKSEGALSDTTVKVRWAWGVAALDKIASQDDGLDAGQDVLNAVETIQATEEFGLIYVSSTQTVDEEGWLIGEITFRAIHHLPLQAS